MPALCGVTELGTAQANPEHRDFASSSQTQLEPGAPAWTGQRPESSSQPGPGPFHPPVTLPVHYQGIRHRVVTEERAKTAAQLRSHFLPPIHAVSLGRFLIVQQDEDSEPSHLAPISADSGLSPKQPPRRSGQRGSQRCFSYAWEGTAKPPSHTRFGYTLCWFLKIEMKTRPVKMASLGTPLELASGQAKTTPVSTFQERYRGKRLFPPTPEESPSSQDTCRVNPVCQPYTPPGLERQESSEGAPVSAGTDGERTPAHTPARLILSSASSVAQHKAFPKRSQASRGFFNSLTPP